MAVDTAANIGDFDTSKPGGGETLAEADDNFRHIKGVLKSNLANIKGTVSATHTELSYVAGVTSAIQTQINTKGAIAGQTWTGAHDFTGATLAVASATLASQPYTKQQVDALVISATAPRWTPTTTAVSKTLVDYEFVNVTASGQTIAFPASPTGGVSRIGIEFSTGITGTLNPNGNNIKGSSGTMTVSTPGMTLTFTYLNSTVGWVLGA